MGGVMSGTWFFMSLAGGACVISAFFAALISPVQDGKLDVQSNRVTRPLIWLSVILFATAIVFFILPAVPVQIAIIGSFIFLIAKLIFVEDRVRRLEELVRENRNT